jgi:hypothetical protein
MTTGKRWQLPASFQMRDALFQYGLHLLWLTALGALGLLLGWWALSQQPYAAPAVPVDGFLAEEQAPGYAFRWMGERGELRLPAGMQQGVLQVRMGTVPGATRPVTLFVPDAPTSMHVRVPPETARTYHVLLPVPQPVGFAQSGTLVLHAPLASGQDDAYGRQFSVFLSEPSLVATAAAPLPLAAGVGSLAVPVLTYLLLALAGVGWRRAAAGAAGALVLLAGGLLLDRPATALLLHWLARTLPLLLLVLLAGVLLRLRWQEWGGLLVIMSVWGSIPWLRTVWISDDAFISFRYALNLLAGHGLVYNPGERVEGYTNFLWTIMSIPVLWLGGNAELYALALTSLIGALVVLLLYLACRAALPDAPWWVWLLGPGFLVLNAPFAVYTIRGSGMETALFTLCVLGGSILYLREHATLHEAGSPPLPWSALVFGVAALVRPEGVLVFGVALLHLLASSYRLAGFWRVVLRFGGAFALVYAPYFVWRLAYYGDLLPNTFYAKTGATVYQLQRGLEYVGGFAQTMGLFWLALALGLGWWGIVAARRYSFVLALLLIYTLYIIAVGGDFFPGYRFFVPLVPLLVLLGVVGIERARRWLLGSLPRLGGVAAPAGLVLLLLLGGLTYTDVRQFDRNENYKYSVNEYRVATYWGKVGRWLAQHAPPDAVIAAEGAGAIAYYSGLRSIDMLGLNDRHISRVYVPEMGSGRAGHEKTDYAYVLRRRPDYIPVQWAEEMETLPAFEQIYRRIDVQLDPDDDVALYVLRQTADTP